MVVQKNGASSADQCRLQLTFVLVPEGCSESRQPRATTLLPSSCSGGISAFGVRRHQPTVLVVFFLSHKAHFSSTVTARSRNESFWFRRSKEEQISTISGGHSNRGIPIFELSPFRGVSRTGNNSLTDS